MDVLHAPRRRQSGRVVLLDRDGTIVVDRHYLADPAGLEFEAGAAQGLRSLYEQGHRLVIVTNQSGIGRGLLSHQQLAEIHDRLARMILAIGARLEAIYYCPHTPEEHCGCRKPKTGLFDRAASELQFDAASATVIGDKFSDVEFGRNAGASTILIAPKLSPPSNSMRPDFTAPNLSVAAEYLSGR